MNDTQNSEREESGDERECCSNMISRLVAEWRLGMFSTLDTNDKTVDLVKTFRPEPKLFWGIIKLFILGWNVSTIAISINDSTQSGFWLAYLTHWGVLSMLFYNLNSFLALVVVPISQDNVKVYNQIIWMSYTVAVNMGFIIVILYWTLDYEGGSITYKNAMIHGILSLLVFLDGAIVNRIPIRFKQISWVYLVELIYILWNIIHAFSGIGNPESVDVDPDTDDDAIYGVLNWNERAGKAVIVIVLVFFLATPLLFLIIWSMSLCFKPRYLDNESYEEISDDEEESNRKEMFPIKTF